jgi:glyoxylase-like metal-dependent hydrolase (beta-lactamase superfamily II)
MVNDRDVDACSSLWLDQPVQPYEVDVLLEDGDALDAGGPVLRVIHTPGHTLGHIALYAEDERLLICGDAVHADDVGWINIYREGAGAVRRAMASIERLSSLRPRWAASGHGAAIDDPSAAFAAAHARYERWLDDPERAAWHAGKRIFAFALMLTGGLAVASAEEYLLSCPWFGDISRHAMRLQPPDFVEPFLHEMRRSGAVVQVDGVLRAAAAHDVPPAERLGAPGMPDQWPPRAVENVRRPDA